LLEGRGRPSLIRGGGATGALMGSTMKISSSSSALGSCGGPDAPELCEDATKTGEARPATILAVSREGAGADKPRAGGAKHGEEALGSVLADHSGCGGEDMASVAAATSFCSESVDCELPSADKAVGTLRLERSVSWQGQSRQEETVKAKRRHTYTHTHTHTHTHTQSRTHSITRTITHTLNHAHNHAQAHTHTDMHQRLAWSARTKYLLATLTRFDCKNGLAVIRWREVSEERRLVCPQQAGARAGHTRVHAPQRLPRAPACAWAAQSRQGPSQWR
jgi:hypothetical protein